MSASPIRSRIDPMPVFHDCEQNSDEWYELRRGIPTASMFATVLAHGVKGGVSKTRLKYLHQLAGERITETPMESYSNWKMDRGSALEADAVSRYEFENDLDVERVGFASIPDDGPAVAGASPDGLVGKKGIAEVKSKEPHLIVGLIESGKFPSEHVAQCQGGMWVCEREWCDLLIYWPTMGLWPMRLHRDEEYIRRLSDGVARFNAELAALTERVRTRLKG